MYSITVVGTGYVGLVTGACLADFGSRVTCVDSDTAKIERLQGLELPFFEPGLPELVGRNVREGRLRFSSDLRGGSRAPGTGSIRAARRPAPAAAPTPRAIWPSGKGTAKQLAG